jgi:hypothetical protein
MGQRGQGGWRAARCQMVTRGARGFNRTGKRHDKINNKKKSRASLLVQVHGLCPEVDLCEYPASVGKRAGNISVLTPSDTVGPLQFFCVSIAPPPPPSVPHTSPLTANGQVMASVQGTTLLLSVFTLFFRLPSDS